MSISNPREHQVANLSELEPAPSMRPFEIGETRGLLIRLSDGVHAVSGLCPHAKALLHEGALCGSRLVCPWHQSVFEIKTGDLLEPPALDGLDRYEVRVDGDAVYVTLPKPAEEPPAAPAPYVPKASQTVLVVGAGAAGQVAVETLRKEGFAGRIVLAGLEQDPPYDRTNLSKHFLSGKAKREDLPLRREPEFLDRIGIERKIGVLQRLDAESRTAAFADGEIISYDAAILATGGQPKPLDIPGSDHARVCLLRTLADAEQIIGLIDGKPKPRAVAIGASFIGMEAVSSLAQRGVQVTVASAGEIPFEHQFGPEVGSAIRHLHEQNGVKFLAGAKIASIADAGKDGVSVHFADGSSLSADVVIVGVGVRPATDYLVGVELAKDGGVIVDEYLQAGEGLYAVGDIATFPLPSGQAAAPGERVRIEHWRVAQQHALLVARNIAHPERRRDLRSSGFVPFFWTYHFEQRMNYVGHATTWDEIVFDGDPNAPPFIAYYVVDGKTIAAAGTHRDSDLAAMHELLRLERAPTLAQLRAGGYRPTQACASNAD